MCAVIFFAGRSRLHRRPAGHILISVASQKLRTPLRVDCIFRITTSPIYARLDAKMGDAVAGLDAKTDDRYGRLDAKIDRLDVKMDAGFGRFERKLDQFIDVQLQTKALVDRPLRTLEPPPHGTDVS